MDIDYKLNYLSKTFSKIDRKGIETYVIARIWNKLDNLDVKMVCQQYVKREDGYALLDLYFPQINFGVEVNEKHHLTQEEEDKARKQEVEFLANVTIHTIHCEKSSLIDIHKQIDDVVTEIKNIINTTPNFKPWHDTLSPKDYREQGILRVEDDIMLSTVDDICDLFEVPVPKRGFLRCGAVELSQDPNIIVWWPNAVHKNWANEITVDQEIITEYYKLDLEKRNQHIEEHLKKGQRRITFYHKRDIFGISYYRFVGVYEIDKELSKKENKCIWRRVDTEYKF